MNAAGSDLAALEDRLGHRFGDRSLLARALTHSSAVAELGLSRADSYQRLEFLGDRVLALVVAEMLTAAFPDSEEGDLARRLTSLVRNETCADVAAELDLGPAIRLGAGEIRSGGRKKAAILGDVCEAVIGAVYLDGGFPPARDLVRRLWQGRMLRTAQSLRDAKSTLQEWAQGRGLATPTYAIAQRHGPHHAPRFEVSVTVEGLAPAAGEGASKREAEQEAATALLVREGVWQVEHQ